MKKNSKSRQKPHRSKKRKPQGNSSSKSRQKPLSEILTGFDSSTLTPESMTEAEAVAILKQFFELKEIVDENGKLLYEIVKQREEPRFFPYDLKPEFIEAERAKVADQPKRELSDAEMMQLSLFFAREQVKSEQSE